MEKERRAEGGCIEERRYEGRRNEGERVDGREQGRREKIREGGREMIRWGEGEDGDG